MALEIEFLPPFEKHLSNVLKKFPKAEKQICDDIRSLTRNQEGFLFPGFGDHQVRKLRIPVKAYKISKQKGLRLIYAVKGNRVIPLYIYHKANYKCEDKVIAEIKAALKEFINEKSSPDLT